MPQTNIADNEFRDAIAAQYQILSEGFSKKDAAIVARQFFTADAWSIGAQDETAIGADQIEKLYADFVPAYTFSAKSVAPHRLGDAGWDYAEVTLKPIDGSGEDHSYKVLYLWQHEGGQWRCKGQMFVEGSFKGAVAGL